VYFIFFSTFKTEPLSSLIFHPYFEKIGTIHIWSNLHMFVFSYNFLHISCVIPVFHQINFCSSNPAKLDNPLNLNFPFFSKLGQLRWYVHHVYTIFSKDFVRNFKVAPFIYLNSISIYQDWGHCHFQSEIMSFRLSSVYQKSFLPYFCSSTNLSTYATKCDKC